MPGAGRSPLVAESPWARPRRRAGPRLWWTGPRAEPRRWLVPRRPVVRLTAAEFAAETAGRRGAVARLAAVGSLRLAIATLAGSVAVAYAALARGAAESAGAAGPAAQRAGASATFSPVVTADPLGLDLAMVVPPRPPTPPPTPSPSPSPRPPVPAVQITFQSPSPPPPPPPSPAPTAP